MREFVNKVQVVLARTLLLQLNCMKQDLVKWKQMKRVIKADYAAKPLENQAAFIRWILFPFQNEAHLDAGSNLV